MAGFSLDAVMTLLSDDGQRSAKFWNASMRPSGDHTTPHGFLQGRNSDI